MSALTRRTVPEAKLLLKARKRVAKMGATELLAWADTAVAGMGRAFTDYQREHQRESLLELRDEAVPALIALVDELLLRDEARS